MSLDPYPTKIPYGRQCIEESDISEVVAALTSEYVTQGPRVEAFESALREVTGARYAAVVSSGTAALHLACVGLGLGPGDLGIVPGITFAATANCLKYVGAEVAFCDVDPTSGLAGVDTFREANPTQNAKALLPVSLTGAVCDLESVAAYAARVGAFVVEDAAHSIGARYEDRLGQTRRSASCCHSDAAILSFHPVKHICAGEGGAVLTNDETLARRVRRLRSHGIEKREDWLYDQGELGCQYRMTDIQAALGASQLRRLNGNLSLRRKLVDRYLEAFAEEPFRSRMHVANTSSASAWHLFVVHFASEGERLAAYRFFHARNVLVQVHYMPVYRHSYYQREGHGSLPGCETYYSGCLSLPLYPSLKDEEQTYVIECLREFLANG